MFNKTAAPVIELPAPQVTPTEDLIPVSVIALELPAPTVGGWDAFLSNRGVEVLTDDIGRLAVSRSDARLLIAEQVEAETRRREAMQRQERKFIEADRLRLARLGRGMPASMIPDGMSAADAMMIDEYASRPPSVREQLWGQELGGSQTSMVYQSFPSEQDES
jgi:hypothetical protein